MAKDKKQGRPKDFPGKETTRIASYIPTEVANKFKVHVLLSKEFSSISQAVNVAIEEFLEKRKVE